MDRVALGAAVHVVAELDMTEQLTHTYTYTYLCLLFFGMRFIPNFLPSNKMDILGRNTPLIWLTAAPYLFSVCLGKGR